MSQTLGDQLRQARQGRNLSLEQAAEGTRIRVHYLEALEAGDFSRLPSKAQARGFLRAYAGYLDLDAEGLLEVIDGGPEEPAVDLEEPASLPAQTTESQPVGSRVIFRQLGEILQRQRETLGFSLEEVERNTRLRRHYLLAFEEGDLEELPSPVQGRGMLQNYAAFLGLDPEPLLLRFADGLQARLAEKQAAAPLPPVVRPVRRFRRGPIRSWLPLEFLLLGGLVALLVGFVIWSVLRINALQAAEEPEVTLPSVADAILATAEVEVTVEPVNTPSPAANTPAPGTLTETELAAGEVTPEPAFTTPPPTLSDAPVQVYVTVLQRAWMRVTVDGVVEFEGRVLPGSAHAFAGTNRIELLTGNGAALQVFFAQTDLGVLGVYGEVVHRVFTPEGLVLPTPSVTPTPTATLQATDTSPLTETPPATPVP